MPSVRYIDVTEPEQMQMQISQLLAAGFIVANQNNRSVTLIKRKQFSIPILIIGLLLCVVPLLIYLIVYALQSDQVVEIRLVEARAIQPFRASEHVQVSVQDGPPPQPWPVLQLSPDGRNWWDGSQWKDAAETFPPSAIHHPDGQRWWDGRVWRPLPGTARELSGGDSTPA